MRTRLGRAVRRAEKAERELRVANKTAANSDSESVDELNRRIGEEVTAVLDAARAAAEQVQRAATADADELRAKATADAADIVASGQAEADDLRRQGFERLEQARSECDELIGEAEEARGQILEDMDRRRRQARAQVERLRVGRDRLLRSYDVVRRSLDEATVELKSSLSEAKVRGDGAARAINAEEPANREQLEAELRDAKMIGRIAVSKESGSKESGSKDTAKPPVVAGPPKAPAAAPVLRATPADEASDPKDPIAIMMQAAEAKRAKTHAAHAKAEEVNARVASGEDEEATSLSDEELTVVEPPHSIEEVVAVPAVDASEDHIPGIEAQRDAIIADAARQLEKRLKRALADEQNAMLAGIRSGDQAVVDITAIVGDVDTQVGRYVVAINEVAAVTYGAGAALVDVEVSDGQLPAGAVEELLQSDVVLPMREQLESLDDLNHDPVRAFYHQQKDDHLGVAASRLAHLLCVAGLCDALPDEAGLPWPVGANN